MKDIDINASASAEANVVKIGDPTFAPTVNFNLGGNGAKPDKEPFVYRVLSGPKRALHPAEHARELAEAASIRDEAEARSLVSRERAIAEACRICREGNPWLSERQAYLHVMGHNVTPAEAENVFEVFEEAQKVLPEESFDNESTDEFKDSCVRGAASAYDDKVRKLWAKLIAGEIEQSGSFSKYTLSVLSKMGKKDVELFEVFCSLCAGGIDTLGIEQPTIPCIFLDETGTTYNEGSISYEAIANLSARSLVQTKSSTVFAQSSGVILCIEGESYKLEGPADERLVIGEVTFTKFGEELSRLCKLGNHPNLMSSTSHYLSEQGFTLVPLNQPSVGHPCTIGGEAIIKEIPASFIDGLF